MNHFTSLAVAGIACLFLVACSEQSSSTTGQIKPTESQSPAPVAATAAPQEVRGTLAQTDKGLAIVTDTGTYVVAGQDLSDMLGKKVKITGAIAEVDGGQVIQVMSVTPVE